MWTLPGSRWPGLSLCSLFDFAISDPASSADDAKVLRRCQQGGAKSRDSAPQRRQPLQ